MSDGAVEGPPSTLLQGRAGHQSPSMARKVVEDHLAVHTLIRAYQVRLTHSLTHSLTHRLTRIQTLTHLQKRTHSHTNTHSRTNRLSHLNRLAYTYIQIYIRPQTHTHTQGNCQIKECVSSHLIKCKLLKGYCFCFALITAVVLLSMFTVLYTPGQMLHVGIYSSFFNPFVTHLWCVCVFISNLS